MTGSGAAGGFEYQAKAVAFVAVHILTQQKLNWIDEADDVPTAVAVETGGAGDDLDITLQNGTIIELQAKQGLARNKLWDAIVKLTKGLQANSLRYGVLLIDSTSSGIIKDDLRVDLIRLGQGRTDELKEITQDFLQRLIDANIPNEAEIFRRLSICVLDLDDDQTNAASACGMLSQILEEKNKSSSAWKIFWGEGLHLTKIRGRRDAMAWVRLLSNESIRLAATTQNPIVITEKYRDWLKKTTAHLTIPGIDDKFSMANDWISLQARECKNEVQKPFEAAFIPRLFRLSIIVGESGSGKSTLTKYLAHHLTKTGKTVLRARLVCVGKLLKSKLFEDAVIEVAAEGSSLISAQLKFALCYPDYLLVDGLDECKGEQANLASQLCDWSTGHPNTKIIVTTRPDYEREYFSNWKCLELLPLEESDIQSFSERALKTITDRDKFMSWIKTSEVISVAVKTPLLLGFLIKIFQESHEPIQSRAKIYEKIINLAYEKSLLDRELSNLSETKVTTIHILEVVGWELISSFGLSEKDLRQAVALRLVNDLSIGLLDAKNKVEHVLNFWIQRRILDRIKIQGDDFIKFTHESINEYASGCFINNNMSSSDFRKWYLTSKKSFISKESITFATELGAAEKIIDALLILDNDNLIDENDILLSSEILKKVNDPSLLLVEKVFKQLELVLVSPIQSNVFRAASNLISFSENFTQLISGVAITHLNHHQSWTRLAAFQIALAIDSDNIDVNQLEKQTDQIINEIEENEKEYLKPVELSKIFVSAFFRRKLDDFQKQFLINSFRYLLKNSLSVENIQRFESVLTKESLSDAVKYSLVELVCELIINPSDVGLLHLDPKYLNLFTVIIKWETLRREKIIKMTESHEKMKFEKHNEVIGKVFLESIIRVVEEESIVSEALHEFLLLGILIQGMCLWTATMLEWREIDQCPNVNAVDVVVKGAIIAMQINEQALGAEARTLLIKIEEKTVDNILTHIPQVPAEPQWQLVENVDVSVDQLKEALDHSSAIIKVNAAMFLSHKIGEDETIDLLKSKNLWNGG
jgi:ABC-type oligopeptide transport system ATPase subunit